MPARNQRRGSVLLMAVGLLTILSILASTFLIVSNLDAREADVLLTKAYSDPIAEGALRNVAQLIAADLHMDANLAYGDTADGQPGWEQFVDVPAMSEWGVAGGDVWLATPVDPNFNRVGPKLSNVFGRQMLDQDGGTMAANTPHWQTFYPGASNANYTDADGDGIRDARLYYAYPMSNPDPNDREPKYRAAVRVVDLSGKLNVNTAGEPWTTGTDASQWPRGIPQVHLDLAGFLRDTTYQTYSGGAGGVHSSRCGGTPAVLRDYGYECVRRLLSPDTDYDPFGIGDEVFLLWHASLDERAVSHVGRLYDLLHEDLESMNAGGGDPNNNRGDRIKRQLTTFNCSSPALRYPQGTLAEKIHLDVRNHPQEAYEQMLWMLSELGIGEDPNDALARQKMAAHFVANSLAYLSPGEYGEVTEGWPWAFQPEGLGFVAFGTKQDLVIVEAVARHLGPTVKPDGSTEEDWACGYAFEILNPTGRAVDMATDRYQLDVDGDVVGLAGTVPAATGTTPGRLVVYNYISGGDANAPEEKEVFNVSDLSGWTKASNLDLRGEGEHKVRLLRQALNVQVIGAPTGQTTHLVPIDEFTNGEDELAYSPPESPSQWIDDEADVLQAIARDDRYVVDVAAGQTRKMTNYNLAYWTDVKDTHTLGSDNGITNADTQLRKGDDGVTYAVGFSEAANEGPINIENSSAGNERIFRSIGELCNIYLCGPIENESGFPQRIINWEGSPIFADSPARGRLAYAPTTSAPDCVSEAEGVHYGGYRLEDTPSDRYPDVPIGCFYGEFFTRVLRHRRAGEQRSRTYGLLNINTATREALASLPWPASTDIPVIGNDAARYTINVPQLVEEILRYRGQYERRVYEDGEFRNIDRADYAQITELREASNQVHGFLTPGELAIPLAHYMDDVIATAGDLQTARRDPDYLKTRHALYTAVADCITTQSNTFAVYVTVTYGSNNRYTWNYVAVLDRSGMTSPQHAPAVLLFSEVK